MNSVDAQQMILSYDQSDDSRGTMNRQVRINGRRRISKRSWMRFCLGCLALLTSFLLILCDSLPAVSRQLGLQNLFGAMVSDDLRHRPLTPSIDIIPLAKPRQINNSFGVRVEEVEPPKVRIEDEEWVKFPEFVDETDDILRALKSNGTYKHHRVRTHTARIFGLPASKNGKPIQLLAGPVHHVRIVSVGENGAQRRAGGDYYETDLSSPFWKSRPPVIDLQDGTYGVSLQVDPRFVGLFKFRVILLFANFHALDPLPDPPLPTDGLHGWARLEPIVSLEIEFVPASVPRSSRVRSPKSERNLGWRWNARAVDGPVTIVRPAGLQHCSRKDYRLKRWSGRWTRESYNEKCHFDGRSGGTGSCLRPGTQCEQSFCQGDVSLLESNGWVYSAHCSFQIFTPAEAWKCLDRKWLFWLGDSTDKDTALNLLNFVLQLNVSTLGQRTDAWYFRGPPRIPSSTAFQTLNRRRGHGERGEAQRVRLTFIYNGHADEKRARQGLFSLADSKFFAVIRSFFKSSSAALPNFVIVDSGLEDAWYWKEAKDFVEGGVRLAVRLWKYIYFATRSKFPVFIYRSAFATAGRSRGDFSNPHKIELYNRFFAERLLKLNLGRFRVVDGFDLTFPWHLDHNCSDGARYGKPPSMDTGVDDHHYYFVDLMLVHILLNAICATN